jgi:hypothetical protein
MTTKAKIVEAVFGGTPDKAFYHIGQPIENDTNRQTELESLAIDGNATFTAHKSKKDQKIRGMELHNFTGELKDPITSETGNTAEVYFAGNYGGHLPTVNFKAGYAIAGAEHQELIEAAGLKFFQMPDFDESEPLCKRCVKISIVGQEVTAWQNANAWKVLEFGKA